MGWQARTIWRHRRVCACRSRGQRHCEAEPRRGWDTVTTPGAVADWVALSGRFGKLPFADLLEPAIELAERGA